MRKRRYKVTLVGYITEVCAFNEQEAIILAQAEAIKEARNYAFVVIKDLTLDRINECFEMNISEGVDKHK